MDIRNTRQLKDFSAGRLANAREGQKIILYFSLITIAVSAVATVVSYILSQQIAKTGGLGSMGVRSALTTAQTLLPLVQAGFLMCLTLGYLATMLRIARGQYASPNGMRLGFDRFWVLLRCTLLKGLIFGGAAAASLYVAMMIYMMTPLSNSAVDILMPLVKNAGASGIALDDATYAQLVSATAPAMVIFGVVEAVTVGLASIWFVVGSVAGLIAAICGGPVWLQIALFFVVSIVCLAATRPLVKKLLHKDVTATNADRVLGQTARVTESIDNAVPTGAVYVGGMTWTARSESGQPIPRNAQVKIVRMEGVRLFVEPV